MKAKLPKDFDWQYYLASHPDLTAANITSQKDAEWHYMVHGHKENRRYKCELSNEIIKSIINSQESKQYTHSNITVFLQWYDDPETITYRTFCLLENLENKYINHIHIFDEHSESLSSLLEQTEDLGKKISISTIDKRLDYATWISFADNHYPEDIKVLINSDIFFDESIAFLKTRNYNKHTLYAITRKDLTLDKKIVASCDRYGDTSVPTNPMYSHDCWIYRDKLKISNIDDLNFDLGKGNCDRLFKQTLDKNKILFINLHKQINAVHVDYRKTRTREEYPLTTNIIELKDVSARNYFDKLELKSYSNKLQNIGLLLTGQELHNGEFDTFLIRLKQSISESKSNKKTSKKINFSIYTQHYIDDDIINDLKNLFKNVSVVHINIPKKYDFYNTLNDDSDLKYGYKSGPNYVFFEAIKEAEIYNTTLFLECDVFFGPNWLHKIHKYCKTTGDFIISGSYWRGENLDHMHSICNQHINGGVCLYATGNNILQSYLHFCKDMLPLYITHVNKHLPYDYVIRQCIEDNFDFDHDHRNLWLHIKNLIIPNNLILNYSASSDAYLKIKDIQDQITFSILHKKNA